MLTFPCTKESFHAKYYLRANSHDKIVLLTDRADNVVWLFGCYNAGFVCRILYRKEIRIWTPYSYDCSVRIPDEMTVTNFNVDE